MLKYLGLASDESQEEGDPAAGQLWNSPQGTATKEGRGGWCKRTPKRMIDRRKGSSTSFIRMFCRPQLLTGKDKLHERCNPSGKDGTEGTCSDEWSLANPQLLHTARMLDESTQTSASGMESSEMITLVSREAVLIAALSRQPHRPTGRKNRAAATEELARPVEHFAPGFALHK